MRPSARIAALIELLTDVEEGIAVSGAPADVLTSNYFRARRYAGSKDRRAITEMLYAILRKRELLLWALGAHEKTARNLVITYLVHFEPESLELLDEGGQFATEVLTDDEKNLIEIMRDSKLDTAPVAIGLNIPTWAMKGFEDRFGEAFSEGASALNVSAPLTLRINPLKVNLEFIDEFIKTEEGFEKTKFSNFGVWTIKNVGLGGIPAYKRGQLEVQDEAAQVASLLVDTKPGMQVTDFCAGAGGKTLMVSAQMENKGQIYAFDISEKRLTECRKRLERSGNRNVQVTRIATRGEGRKVALTPLEAHCDRVYVDVPCSGTGTWRRSPDQRWRLKTEADLRDLCNKQMALLSEGASLVKKGGRLIYMTCSILPSENETIINAFMKETTANWRLMDYRDVWAEALPSECPETASFDSKMLQLVPHIHGTDGFFVAILERV